MGINLGQTSMKAVYFGQTAVKSVFIGSNQVWGGEEPVPPTPTNDWLCFTKTDKPSAQLAVQLDKVGTPNDISLEYSTDGNNWSDYTWSGNTGLTISLTNVGDKVYLRAKNENTTLGSSASNYYKFISSNYSRCVAVSGNIQTLLKADGSRVDAPQYCYYMLFSNMIEITSAPELPATTLANHCYNYMFFSCTSLTTAPALPATTLADQCYQGMFSNCSSLTTAPALPAMTLAIQCYDNMFASCTSLTTAPALPATTLAVFCYGSMFSNCSSLSSVEVAFTDWRTSINPTLGWLNNVAASGTFTCPSTLPDERGVNNIPDGWTKVDAA